MAAASLLSRLGWYAAAAILAVLLARIAVIVQMHWAPLVLFPLLCGGVLGGGLVLLSRLLRSPPKWFAVVLAAIAGMILSAGQHGFAYLDYCRGYEANRQRKPEVQLAEQIFSEVRPRTFPAFMRESANRGRLIRTLEVRGWGAWTLWGLEAVVVSLSAVAVVLWLLKPVGESSRPPPIAH